MKKVSVREWDDLNEKEREAALENERGVIVEMSLDSLWAEVERDEKSESDAYEIIGCSKHYAETTAWFVQSCFYEKHKEDVDNEALESLSGAYFDIHGHPVSL